MKKIIIPVLVFAIAAFVYSQYGFHRLLTRDNANLLYSAQRMAQGVPPYLSIFNHTVPLASMVAGLGVMVSNQLNLDDLYTVRFIFFIIACFGVVSVYLLGNSLFRSEKVGFLGALTFLGFYPFATAAASGPQKKTPMVLFETLSLLLTSQRKWFWAGLCGSLSFLTWQPTAIFPIVTLILAATSPREERFHNIFQTLIGMGLPLVIVSIYFQYYGAFYEFLDGAILFNIWYLDRGQSSFISHFLAPIRVIVYGYRKMRIPIFIGFIMIGYIYFWRLSQYQSFRDWLLKDKFSPVLLSFPAPVVWSLLDFQRSPDFFIFLTYIAIGFGHFLDLPFEKAKKLVEKMRNRVLYKRVSLFIALGLCIALIVSGIHTSRHHKFDLYYQKQSAIDIENRFGKDVKLVSIGLPELLVLLHRKNPTRYVFIINGIDRHIHANTPGGFEGWLMELEAYRPEVIALGPTQGIHIFKLMDWLKSRYHQEKIGPYNLYVRNPVDQ